MLDGNCTKSASLDKLGESTDLVDASKIEAGGGDDSNIVPITSRGKADLELPASEVPLGRETPLGVTKVFLPGE